MRAFLGFRRMGAQPRNLGRSVRTGPRYPFRNQRLRFIRCCPMFQIVRQTQSLISAGTSISSDAPVDPSLAEHRAGVRLRRFASTVCLARTKSKQSTHPRLNERLPLATKALSRNRIAEHAASTSTRKPSKAAFYNHVATLRETSSSLTTAFDTGGAVATRSRFLAQMHQTRRMNH